jgi:hypothetical protein
MRRMSAPRAPQKPLLGRLRSSPSTVAGVVVFALVLALWLWRVQRSVELSDESLSVGMPLRFVLGDYPFRDDRSVGQIAALFATPLVAAYHFVVRSNAGIVLFMRLAYLAYLCAIGLALARAVRGWISPAAALACAAVTCFYAPYSILQLSYNTLGGGLALLAMASSLRVARSTTAKEASRHAMIVGFAAAGSACAYPTLGLLFPVHFATLLVFGRAHLGAGKIILRFAVGGAAVGVYVLVFLARSGFDSVRLTVEFTRAFGLTPPAKMSELLTGVNQMKTNWFTSFAVAGMLTALATRFRPAVILLAVAVPFLAAPTMEVDVCDTMRFFSCVGLFAPFFAVLVTDRRSAFRVLAIVWFPAVLTGLVTGWTSSNKWNACGHGGFAAMLACTVLAARACEEAVGTLRLFASASGLAPALALLCALTGRLFAPSSVYRDIPPLEMTARVRSGPFLGLLTSEKRRDMVEQMHADITQHVHGARFVLFLPDMPSGYLSANARPAVPEMWAMSRPAQSAIDAQVYRERAADIGLVVVRSCDGTRNWQRWEACTPTLDAPADPLQAAVLESTIAVVERPDYTVRKLRRAITP